MNRPPGDPSRLVETDAPEGRVLRAALPAFDETPREAAAFARLCQAESRERHRRTATRAFVGAGVVALGSALLTLLALHPWHRPVGTSTIAKAPTAGARREGAGSAGARAKVSLSSRTPENVPRTADVPPLPEPVPAPLPAGGSRLPDTTEIWLSRGGRAEVRQMGRNTERVSVALARGSLRVRRKAASEPALRVEVGSVHVEVADAEAVVVARSDGHVEVAVNRGEARIYASTTLLRRIMAGQRFSLGASEPSPSSGGPAAILPRQAPAEERPRPEDNGGNVRCLSLARAGATREAESCLGTVAATADLEAELALYELARLRHNVLRDDGGALAAVSAYRRRFPGGALSVEIDQLAFDLLAGLGRYADALADSRDALARRAPDGASARLRLARARVLSRDLHDCQAALPELAAAAGAGAAEQREAAFERGVCLASLGRREEATAVFRAVAADPRSPFAAAAAERLRALAP